jgi:hypothetical protein
MLRRLRKTGEEHVKSTRHPTLVGLVAFLAFATSLGGAGIRPASADCRIGNCTVTLTTDKLTAGVGQTITLTATTSQEVLPPYHILIFDAVGTFLVGQCDNGSSCPVSVLQATPAFRTFTAYVARYSDFLFPPDVQATSSDIQLSWLFPVKLYAFRSGFLPGGPDTVFFFSDSGGTEIFSPYQIEIFNKDTGDRVASCAGPQRGGPDRHGIIQCSGATTNSSGAMYWAIIAQPSTNLNTVTDLRTASYYKCVDPSSSSAPICGNTPLAPP